MNYELDYIHSKRSKTLVNICECMINEDWHLNNFNIIRNVKSLKWTRICPIFDTGRSVNTNISKAYWDFDTGEVKCFTKNFISSEELLEFINYKLSNK